MRVGVERLLQICMAIVAVLSTSLLGIAEGNLALPPIAVCVAIGSVILNDIYGWVRLNSLSTNVACLLCVMLAFLDWNRYQVDSQLLALSNLLVYLQFVLLFRRKNTSNYWLQALLSVLQVAVATAMANGMIFGVLLLAYFFMAIVSLSLFHLYRELEQGRALAADEGRMLGQVVGAQASKAGVGSGFFREVTMLGLGTLIITAIIFVSLPRTGQSRWRNGMGAMERVVGYTEEVSLGEFNQVHESGEEVMQVRFQLPDGSPYPLLEDALFRGTVLTRYRRGNWVASGGMASQRRPSSRHHSGTEPILQTVKMAEPSSPVLFAVWPVYRPPDGAEVMVEMVPERLVGSRQFRENGLREYSLLTDGLQNHRQARIRPASEELHPFLRRQLTELPLYDGADPLPTLKNLAKELTDDINPNDPIGRARRLDAYLREEGGFRYSLQPVQRDLRFDPMEDFIVNNRMGNCEYFASALALMLRSLDIPSRVVVGFKGGEWDPRDHLYEIRDLDAHTWVEIFVTADDLKNYPDLLSQLEKQGGGDYAWVTFDPTPMGDEDPGPLLAQVLRKADERLHTIWTKYVMGMNQERQRQSIYEPVKRYATQAAERIAKPLRAVTGWSMPRLENWLNWRGGVLASAFFALLAGVVWLVRYAWRRFWMWIEHRLATRLAHDRRTEFYRTMEGILARHNHKRPPNSTPREFALATGEAFRQSGLTTVADVPQRIVDFFYGVRYGGRSLDSDDERAVEQALFELRQALESNGHSNGAVARA